MYLLTRKNELAKNLKMMESNLEDLFTFTPKTWLIPGEMVALKAYISDKKKDNKSEFFIIKPEANSKGIGIKVIHNVNEINFSEESRWVVQKYMSNP